MSSSTGIALDHYGRAASSLLALIRGERHGSRSSAQHRQRAEIRLSRVRTILRSMGDPQHRYPIVHITGTSGKGSTAAMVAAILTAAGYRVGIRTSPYLQVPTEKLQIGSSLIDARSFANLVERILDTTAGLFPPHQTEPPMSYAEVWSVLGYQWFAERNVDLAVVEVGAGGRFDATSVIEPIVSVITSVGLDHLATLGPTLADIAWHKAGIIRPGSLAIVGDLSPEAFAVIASEADSVSAELIRAADIVDSRHVAVLPAHGFQRRNAEIATAVATLLRRRGFTIANAAINEGIVSARLPGRLERMPDSVAPAVWIDGAHNADKIAALAGELCRLFASDPLPVIVLGMLKSKDPARIVAALGPAASSVVLTEPVVDGREPLEMETLARALKRSGFSGPIYAERDIQAAVSLANDVASRQGAPLLVTGSMYLAGEARRGWYPDSEIVLQRTPWPTTGGTSRLRPPGPFGGLVRDDPYGQRNDSADHQYSAVTEELLVR